MKKRWIALMTVWAMLAYVLAGCGGTTASSDELEASSAAMSSSGDAESEFYIEKMCIRDITGTVPHRKRPECRSQ